VGKGRTFDPEGGLARAHRRQGVLDLHQLTRRAARHKSSSGQQLTQSIHGERERERERERGSWDLKVVREKEYWLSPMADYLAGRLLPFLSSGNKFVSNRRGRRDSRVESRDQINAGACPFFYIKTSIY